MNELAPDINEAAEFAAKMILDGGYVERWVEGCIFPSEMAFFIATCEVNKVLNVLESGRQDGYSTEILADWASRAPDRHIISIDLEVEVERAKACRARLQKWKSLELIAGNAYAEFGRAAKKLTKNSFRKTAFLVDGPKRAPAISMMAAAMSDSVCVIASHNLIVGSQEYEFFHSLGGDTIFFEHALTRPGPHWRALREREVSHAIANASARSVELSSIGVLVVDRAIRKTIENTRGPAYGLHQPYLVKALWRMGTYGLTPKLYGISQRMFGR